MKINIACLIIISCFKVKFVLAEVFHRLNDFPAGAELVSTRNKQSSESFETNCASLADADKLTQIQLINRLTATCRYDRLERPHTIENGRVTSAPMDIFMRVYIYVLENLEPSGLKFKIHGLIQMRYHDPRLQFSKYAPNRTEPIVGESSLRNLIWMPHIFLANEHNSNILGTNEKDILIAISPEGAVITSSRFQATLYCWMKLQKFPFDEQFCPTMLESWMYNSSQLLLHWEKNEPIVFDTKLQLTEYALQEVSTNETIIKANLNDLHQAAFGGNYSSIKFTIHLTREVGYYFMDYFLPSIMIVAISWVSFWLQADQTPARTTLGCATLLSFITLANSQDHDFPKINCIKISEIWFLGCTSFIFGSLVEFAFANTIWRRKHNIEVEKVNSKHILKSTLASNLKRQKMLDNAIQFDNYPPAAVLESPVIIAVEEECTNKFTSTESIISQSSSLSRNEYTNGKDKKSSWATMTPHEVSLWIDKKARFAFPLAFILFNAFFWAFVYSL